jgi:spore germination protein GerM
MKKTPWWVWAIGAFVIVAALVGGVFIGRMTANGPESGTPTGEPTSSTQPTASTDVTSALPASHGSDETPSEPARPRTVRLYFVRGEDIGVVSRQIPATKAVATAAVQQLLLGPTALEQGYGFTSEIPVGTDLRGVTIKNGTATVDLSRDFEAGGGTLSVSLRLAQLVYTLTQFPTVDAVEFYLNGARVDVFSSEGLILDGPQRLEDYDALLPIDA